MACKQIGTSFVTSCDVFNRHLCIICQKATKSPLYSKESCLSQMRAAANIRKDEVADRINKLEVTDKFFYHMTNVCYKNYTHSGRLKQIGAANAVATSNDEMEMEIDVSDEPNTSQRQTRRTSTPRAPPSSDIDPTYDMLCVVCGNKSKKKFMKKYGFVRMIGLSLFWMRPNSIETRCIQG